MDRTLARKLERDETFRRDIFKLASEYLKLGRDGLNHWTPEFDAAYDSMMCYAALEKKDYEALERGHPKRFVLPLTANQITTMATYVAQVLFGQETPHRVEGRGAEDEVRAEMVNQLLRWNSEQQSMYLLGYLWAQDAIAVNRGVLYDGWNTITRTSIEPVPVEDPEEKDAEGNPVTYLRFQKAKKIVGGFCKLHLVSPYDFVCDPSLPLWRLQDMRFCGHRTMIPMVELERRAKLPVDDPMYVMPWAVQELKEKSRASAANAIETRVTGTVSEAPGTNERRISRTAYERGRSGVQGSHVLSQANKNDHGNVECYELWATLIPKDNGLHDGDDPVKFQMLTASDVVLSLNESTYAHDQYPYSVGEGRPGAHFQFAPGWAQLLSGLQSHVDWLKNRHQEALSRTVGNVFIADPSRVDMADFLDPDKEGLVITLKENAYGTNINDIIKQVPIKDMTERFHEEMMQFVSFSESVTAANSSMQGGPMDVNSATQYAGTQQMAAGRMTSIARLLSSSALVPQTKRIVSNFQQFMEVKQEIRFRSDTANLPPELQSAKSVELSRDIIQGEYDYIAHDGTLPGTDARRVAAITKLLELGAVMPQVFQPAPGNLDPRLLIHAGAKAAGLNVERFYYDASQFQAQPMPASPEAPGGIPGPAELGGPAPGVGTPGPAPAVPDLPDLNGLPALPTVEPPQVRPGNF